MNKLKEFIGAPKETDINGKKLTLYPLKVEDLKLFKEKLTEEEQVQVAVKIIQKSINDPEVTEEDVKEMGMEEFVLLMDEIYKLNGMENERIIKIKERVARARA